MLRRTLALSAVLTVALAFPAERSNSPPDVSVLTQPASAAAIDVASLLLPSVAIAQAPVVADTTVQTERHSHGVVFWAAWVLVAGLIGYASWRFSARGSDTGGGSGGGYASGSASSGSSGSASKRAT